MAFGFGFGMPRSFATPFSPASLFATGAPGAWYDPSDRTTLFQDSAGTTPVTAVEQPVGLMLDKSGRGNHAFQSTAASRPVLSARYNLLTKTEQFDDAAWTKTSVTVTANAATAPDGTTTADKLVVTGGLANVQPFSSIPGFTAAASVTASVRIKPAGKTHAYIQINGSPTLQATFITVNLSTGVVGTPQVIAGTGIVGAAMTATAAGDGYYTLTFTGGLGAGNTTCTYIVGVCDAQNSRTSSASGTDGVFIWGASLVPANQSTLPYQRVNTSTDYATTGFLPYLKFDGVDDSLSTNSINFTSTDKMSVFAGVRKLSDAATAMLVELSTDAGSVNGSFHVQASANTYGFALRGTAVGLLSATPFTAPVTNVISAVMDISQATLANELKPRINRVIPTLATTIAGPAGSGNFGNYPLYIGRRGGTSLPFNGQLYSMIIVGKAVTAGELSSSETYVNQKTGAY